MRPDKTAIPFLSTAVILLISGFIGPDVNKPPSPKKVKKMVTNRIMADSQFTVHVDEKYYSEYLSENDTLHKSFVCNLFIDHAGERSVLINGNKRNYLITKDSTYSYSAFDTTSVTAREFDILKDFLYDEYMRLLLSPKFFLSRLFFGKASIDSTDDVYTVVELMKKRHPIRSDGYEYRRIWVNTEQRVDSIYLVESMFGDDLSQSEFKFEFIPGPIDEHYVKKRDKILRLRRKYGMFDVVLDENE